MVVSENSFHMTEIHARSVGATIVRCPEINHRVDVDAILEAVTRRTRVAYLCSPNNPTGTHTTREELRRLDAGLPADILLIVDAAYAEFVDAPDYDTGQSLFSRRDGLWLPAPSRRHTDWLHSGSAGRWRRMMSLAR